MLQSHTGIFSTHQLHLKLKVACGVLHQAKPLPQIPCYNSVMELQSNMILQTDMILSITKIFYGTQDKQKTNNLNHLSQSMHSLITKVFAKIDIVMPTEAYLIKSYYCANFTNTIYLY